MSGRFAGRVAFVTGAAGAGIGQATARRLAAEGATVIVTDAHERRTGQVTAAIRADLGADAMGIVLDVADAAAVGAAVRQVADRYGRIDVLVNNAAVNPYGHALLEVTADEWDRVTAVDLDGPYHVIRAVLPVMIERGGGAIVNVSSLAAYTHGGLEVPYAVSKAGLQQLTRAVAHAYGPQGVRCNAVAPGIIETRFVANFDLSDRLATLPLRRFGKPEEVAAVIAFLASDDASYVTGETLGVGGGALLHQ